VNLIGIGSQFDEIAPADAPSFPWFPMVYGNKYSPNRINNQYGVGNAYAPNPVYVVPKR
jgi:hypothetical protein